MRNYRRSRSPSPRTAIALRRPANSRGALPERRRRLSGLVGTDGDAEECADDLCDEVVLDGGCFPHAVEGEGDGGVEVSAGEGGGDGEGEVVEAADEELVGGVEDVQADGVGVPAHAHPVGQHSDPHDLEEDDGEHGPLQEGRQLRYLALDPLLLLVGYVDHTSLIGLYLYTLAQLVYLHPNMPIASPHFEVAGFSRFSSK